MSNIRDEVSHQLQDARTLLAHIQAEKIRTKAELTKRLEQIDATFAPRLDGAEKAVNAYEQLLATFSSDNVLSLDPMLVQQPVLEMRPTVQRVFEQSHEVPMHLDEITARVKSLGVQTRAQNISEAVRAAIYGLIEKGEPITRVAERTWAWSDGPSSTDATAAQ